MFAIGASTNAFGSTNATNTPDNGIDITNLRIEFTDADGDDGGEEPPVEPSDDGDSCFPVTGTNGNTSVICF